MLKGWSQPTQQFGLRGVPLAHAEGKGSRLHWLGWWQTPDMGENGK
jgi:hypothetical protein